MNIPNQHELKLLHTKVCQAIADEKRIQIIYALHEKPCYVSELADLLAIPQPTVSRHLSILRQRNIVKSQRDGATVVYSLTDERIVMALDLMRGLLRDLIQEQADSFIDDVHS
jgi:DNA-binding transcriptional ArsR family regulator